ncbi:MAG: hypothetical protein IT454_16095 [Planctomycetes bacterium]|nr:hypothetical protein [Planctomycetota bacterium]
MNERQPPPVRALEPSQGLCPQCAHVRRIESAKGSVFWMCEKSRDDPRYPRYPAQPRMVCPGFER